MDMQSERNGGVLILKPAGRVDGQNAQEFHASLEALLEGGEEAVILDMEDMHYISSAGLRVILLIAKLLHQREAQFVLCSLQDMLKNVFVISGFEQFMPLHESRDAALTAVKRKSKPPA